MNYIYDLVLNFNDCSKKIDFYEWKKQDNIITIQKIPLIRINRFQMNDILNNKVKISNELLNKIKDKTVLEDKRILKYTVLITDLSKVLALEFNDLGEVCKSSSLLLDEEEAVIDESLEYSEEVIDYKIVSSYANYEFLTREERNIRNNLLTELKTLYKNKNYDEIKYLYEELYDKKSSIHEVYKFLIDDIKNNYNSKYNKLYDIIKLT